MAILTPVGTGADMFAVRIIKHPENTYFDEYVTVKAGTGEKSTSTTCERFITAEPNQGYKIELKLRAGFDFGDYDFVEMKLFLPGKEQGTGLACVRLNKPDGIASGRRRPRNVIQADMATLLELADVNIDGKKVLGARFGFRGLVGNEILRDGTNVFGVAPLDLARFGISVTLCKEEPIKPRVSGGSAPPEQRAINFQNGIPKLWEAREVDETSFADGITCAFEFVGGHSVPQGEKANHYTLKPGHQIRTSQHGTLNFTFQYRSPEYVEVEKLFKFPPPLHAWAWKDLTASERKTTLAELQTSNREYVRAARQANAKPNINIDADGQEDPDEEPMEWRAGTSMTPTERAKAYRILRESNAKFADAAASAAALIHPNVAVENAEPYHEALEAEVPNPIELDEAVPEAARALAAIPHQLNPDVVIIDLDAAPPPPLRQQQAIEVVSLEAEKDDVLIVQNPIVKQQAAPWRQPTTEPARVKVEDVNEPVPEPGLQAPRPVKVERRDSPLRSRMASVRATDNFQNVRIRSSGPQIKNEGINLEDNVTHSVEAANNVQKRSNEIRRSSSELKRKRDELLDEQIEAAEEVARLKKRRLENAEQALADFGREDDWRTTERL